MIAPGGAQESSLLLTLEEISQLVAHSHRPGETLANIVRLIQGRIHTDVCSVYLLETDRGELVLGATIGLKPESIGRVRMRLDEGLSGLVAEKRAPVMVEDAFMHPRFKFFPEAGEDPYHSFLGVPLIEGGILQGVLVVQTRDPRLFSVNEVRLLVAVAAQLAPLVSEARLLELVAAATHQDQKDRPCGSITWHGLALSSGIGIGHAYLINGFEAWLSRARPRTDDPVFENKRLEHALDGAREELGRLSQRISALVGEEHGAILQGQLMILQDNTIEQDLRLCVAGGITAEGALLETFEKYAAAFHKLTNPYFQERVYDIKDVFRRILWHLRPQAGPAEPVPEQLVLVAHDVSVMDLFSVDLDRLAAVVVQRGGLQSHAAILARSLGIPLVAQIPELLDQVEAGDLLRVDGNAGEVCLNPPAEIAQVRRPAPHAALAEANESAISRPTPPGLPRIEANVNLIFEVDQALRQGAAGVGLFRTEFLFLARRTLPTEEEQVEIYRKLLDRLHGRPATIRTYDLRPDKVGHLRDHGTPSGQRLDWRLVLESPPIQKLFRDQVRAILRAGTAGPVRILVPLVTRTEQLDFIVTALDEVRDELKREGVHHAAEVPFGVMVEVAAVTPMIDAWAPKVQFFALGTNDLVASALGITREESVEIGGCDPLHPGVLGLLHQIINAAKMARKPVTVCGEMAGDPEGAVALTCLGVDSLSVAVHQISALHQVLAKLSNRPLPKLAARLPELRTAAEVKTYLSDQLG